MTTTDGGTFGYIFHGRDFDAHSEPALRKLAGLMVSPASPPPPEGRDDPEEATTPIPAGYTYLGQFIDHDMVFDETSSLTQLNDPNTLRNSRAPRFDLDSLYGHGPHDPESDFYEHAPTSGHLFRLGETVSGDPRLEGPDLPRDPRDSRGRTNVARIGDPRNDENLIISQLHTLLLRFHNTMARRVAAARPTLTGDALFEEVRRQVCWHYQWVVVHDFLPRIVGQSMVDSVLNAEPRPHGTPTTPGRRLFNPRPRVYMPVEFSGAAYRFGHSLVRPVYRINAKIRNPILTSNFAQANLENLLGFRPLPRDWGFQWQYFFELGGNPPGQPMQKARRIDPQLVNPLEALAPRIVSSGGPASLAERNLLRGRALGLLSGQEVARAMGLSPIKDKDLIVGPHGGRRVPITDVATEFRGNAPLWYYILREAEMEHDGNHLGAVGGRLVTEVFVGLLVADPTSYLSVDPTWTPDRALAVGGRFGMPELIRATVEYL